MTGDLVGAVAARSEMPKEDEETLKEYIERVGETTGTDPQVVENAVEYVVQTYYARTPPTDDRPLRRFLVALEANTDTPESDHATGDTGEESPAVGTLDRDAGPPPQAERPPPDRPDDTDAVEELGAQSIEMPPSLRPVGSVHRRPEIDLKGGLRGQEPRRLLLWFVIMIATAPLIGWMLGRTWLPGHIGYDFAAASLGTLLGLSPVGAMEAAGAFGIGLYAAVLALFIADVKKRVQGMLLLLGSVVAIVVIGLMGVLVPNIDFTAAVNIGALLAGVALGIAIEAAELRTIDWRETSFRRPSRRDGEVAEFRLAVYGTFGFIMILLLATIAQAVLAAVVTVYDLAASVVFLVMAYRFVRYESELSYVMLGPARAGKSMLALGLCLELLAADGPHPNPNASLQNGLERVGNLDHGRERWPLPSTPPDDLSVSSLEVIVGYYFPRRFELTALDYAGQHLPRIAERLGNGSGETTGGTERVPARVADWIRDSDTVIVILDIERLVHPDRFRPAGADGGEPISWGFEHYATILSARDPTQTIVVATKCDILLHEGLVDPPTEYPDWAGFRGAVSDHLRERPDVGELLELTKQSEIHPLFYVTKRRNGAYVPRLDEDGNLMPVGFGHLIEGIGRRQ